VLAELVERYPTSAFAADAQFEIAMRKYQAKQFADAAEEFRRVISQFPSYSSADEAHFLMADSYTQSDAVTDAQQAYEQFLMFFPDSELRTTVRFRLGSIRFDGGDYMRAAVDFASVLDDSTTQEIAAASLFNLALCRRMLGETEKAQTALDRYRELYKNDKRAPDVAYQLGEIHDNAGRTDTALKEYRLALKSKPGATLATELHYRMGVCHETLKDDAAAIKSYTKAMAAKKRSDAFRLSAVARCAALYEKTEDYKKAIAAYRDLIKNAKDPELVVAAKERASQLEAIIK